LKPFKREIIMNRNTGSTDKGLGYHPKPVGIASTESFYAARELDSGLLTGGNPAIDATEDDEPYRESIVAGLYTNGLLVSH
jgi:hypothetical protein